jgi:alpha-ketoglutarate-dependent 2,4-dichlorophenoxyacetate dioxygenase
MAITVWPVTEGFAAEIGDVDLSRALELDEIAAIKQAFWDYGVLIFPAQDLTEQQHVDFARHIGPIEISIAALNSDAPQRIRTDLADVSNLNPRNEIWGEKSRRRALGVGNRLWHTDSSFKFLPARASAALRPQYPAGRRTHRICRYARGLRRSRRGAEAAARGADRGACAVVFAGAHGVYKLYRTRAQQSAAGAPQMVVRTIPENGRRSLYIASHIGRIRGMSEDDACALIDGLIAHATQRQFVYTHRWRAGDLVRWDDRCTMHRGTEFDDLRWPRDMHRATVSDIANTCEQAGIAVVAA